MHVVKEAEKTCRVSFGGVYKECWSEDYTMSIEYQGQKTVEAGLSGGVWRALGGDRELAEQLNSRDCPALPWQYFQAAATVRAAVDDCKSRGLPGDKLGECFFSRGNPLTAPELMRVLMDEEGLSVEAAYRTAACCCADLTAGEIQMEQMFPIQSRTGHVLCILRDMRRKTLAVAFDGRQAEFRSPYGAVPCGERIRLSFRVLGGVVQKASLVLTGDKQRRETPMKQAGDRFSVSFKAPKEPAALWFCFKIQTPEGILWLCPDATGTVGRLYDSQNEGFRLTVYKKDFETPAWFRRSVVYQIFPDRFAFSGDGTAEKGVAYHKALGQTPELHGSLEEPVRSLPRPFEAAYSPDDFYGGTLQGIREKLPYLQELGVSCLYLNPIVEARSNHRYDTSDYLRVDPILGTNEDLAALCQAAEALGIRVILDGVFSHTGADSRYFNRYGNYPEKGACQGKDSAYYSWYDFKKFPSQYRCWWGFQDLPEVDEHNPSWQDFVVTGKDSVIKRWLRLGAAGWRLDVADELPDDVLALIRQAAREEKPDALILGEVWEDPVTKISMGGRRNYALGWSLDSVMNYPLRDALLHFVHRRWDAYRLRDFLTAQQMNYPKPLYYSLLNLYGSHDTDRLRTALATPVYLRGLSREEQTALKIGPEALEKALELEKMAAVLQFSLPGVPSIYYGDEQGMTGVNDPFCRAPFKEDPEARGLHAHYAALAALRASTPALSTGEALFMAASADVLLILRCIRGGKDVFGLPAEDGATLTVLNRGEREARFEADCSAAGKGIFRGVIGPESGEIIRL